MSVRLRPSHGRFVVCSLWMAGCGTGDSTPPAKPKVQVVTGHTKAPPGAFEQKAFACCADGNASAVVRSFSALGETLAMDDEAGAKLGAGGLASAMDAVSFAGDASPLAEMVSPLRAAGSLEEVRDAYLAASDPMLAYAKAHKGGTDLYVVGYCSMKPGRWLQTAAELANPYYGSEMLECGTFEALD